MSSIDRFCVFVRAKGMPRRRREVRAVDDVRCSSCVRGDAARETRAHRSGFPAIPRMRTGSALRASRDRRENARRGSRRSPERQTVALANHAGNVSGRNGSPIASTAVRTSRHCIRCVTPSVDDTRARYGPCSTNRLHRPSKARSPDCAVPNRSCQRSPVKNPRAPGEHPRE